MGKQKAARRAHQAYAAAMGALEAVAREWNVKDRDAIVQAAVDWRKSEQRKSPIIAGPFPTNRVSLNHVKPPPAEVAS